MTQRAAKKSGKQVSKSSGPWIAMQQLMLPMLLASDALKQGLLAFVHQMGMLALSEILSQEAESIAGPKGKHAPERVYHHWGSTQTPLPFGGRQVVIERPRVRRKGKGGKEVELRNPSTSGVKS